MRRYADYVPVALTTLRALLAPMVVALSLYGPNKLALGACVVVAFFSDVFDGIIARRLGVATVLLRRFDSIADSIFYAAALLAAWHLYPGEVGDHLFSLCFLIAIEVVRFVFDKIKFKQQAAYHMYSSKVWGVCLFAAFLGLLGCGKGGVWIDFAIYVGIIADIEGLAISMVLRKPLTDISTIFHALRMRHLLT